MLFRFQQWKTLGLDLSPYFLNRDLLCSRIARFNSALTSFPRTYTLSALFPKYTNTNVSIPPDPVSLFTLSGSVKVPENAEGRAQASLMCHG